MTKIAYFPGNTAALAPYLNNPAFQVIADRKLGGFHVLHNPVRGVLCGNTGN